MAAVVTVEDEFHYTVKRAFSAQEAQSYVRNAALCEQRANKLINPANGTLEVECSVWRENNLWVVKADLFGSVGHVIFFLMQWH